MRPSAVWFAAVTAAACASSTADPDPRPGPDAAPGFAATCYTLHPGGTPAPDAALPTIIELSAEPAPGFVEPGRLAVHEPGATDPRAPISWWVPRGADAIELVLGGGYTGYSFDLRSANGGGWVGQGTYFADFGVEPAPASLSMRLTPKSCP
jgi:hypothetical protein